MEVSSVIKFFVESFEVLYSRFSAIFGHIWPILLLKVMGELLYVNFKSLIQVSATILLVRGCFK